MARNSEKAQSMLFRFREAQAADLGIIDAGRARRPKMITEQDSVPACERWRGQVLREISRKVSRIQDPVLSDFQIRDLNDEINKLFREKHAWEIQIRNLGGPNYMRGPPSRVYDESGREVPGGGGAGLGKGYKYFGRARDLPGVKELFEAARVARAERRRDEDESRPLEEREDLRAHVDAAYYGYGPGGEDGALLAYEAAKEREAFEHLASASSSSSGGGEQSREGEGEGEGLQEPPPGWEALPGDAGDGRGWLLPTAEEVQRELLERRKRRILDQL